MARGFSDRAHFRGQLWTIVGRKWIGDGHIPQQRRGMFERVLLRKIDAVHAAVDRPFLGDGRDRRIHHRQIGVEILQAARFRRRRSPLLEAADVLRAVAMTPRIRRGFGADQSPADIGVKRGRGDREFGRRLAGGKVKRGGFFHIDLHNQD